MIPVLAEAAERSADLRAVGLAALRRGDAQAALDALERARGFAPDDADVQQGLGAALLALGQLAAARAAYGAAVALDPSRVDALRGLGHAARRQGDRVEALRWFEAACARDAGCAKHHHEVGEELRHLGRLSEAESAFARALALQPDHRPSLLSCAAIARAQGDLEAALRALKTAAANGPADPAIRRDIAGLLDRLGRYDEAEAIFRALLETEATRHDAVRGLVAVARRRGDGREALALLQQHTPDHDDPRLALEIAALRAAQGEDVEAVYRPLLSNPATRPGACFAIAALARRERDHERARRWLEAALAADPSHGPTGLALSDLYRSCGDLDQAAGVLERLASVLDRDPEVAAAQGRLARTRGQRAAARRFFERAYDLDPATGVTDLARDLREAGAHDEALALIETVRATRPEDVALLVQLGVTARAAGDSTRALAHFDAALTREPGHISAIVEKAATLLRLGRFGAMRELLDRAMAIAPNHPRVLEAYADLALLEDDPASASAALRQAASTGSVSAALDGKRARCEVALGHIESGLQIIDGALAAFGPLPDTLLMKAQILRQCGRIAEAGAVFDTAAARYPHSFPVWFHRALFVADTRAALPIDLGQAPAALPAEDAKVAVVAGVAAGSRWNCARASSHFRRALEGHPTDAAVRTRLAAAALIDLDLGETERQLRHLAEIEAPARRLRGQSLSPFKTLVGQILDEAKIDRVALEQLVEARRMPPTKRLDALAAVVRDNPDMSLAAMQMLVTLRRLGRFDRTHARSKREAEIPRAIVQFWHADDPPADVLDLTRSWVEHNEGFTYRRFADRSARAFLQAEYPSAVADAYAQARDPARKADLFRLAYLARHGGIYADADDRCVAPLDPLLSGGDALVVYQEDIGSIGNNVIAAVPDHPVVLRALDRAVGSAASGDNDIPWLATGPGLMSRVLAVLVAKQGPSFIEAVGIRVLTRRALLPRVAIGCTTAYKHTRRHWSRAAFLAPSARPG